MDEVAWLLTRYGAMTLAIGLLLALPPAMQRLRRRWEQRRIVSRALFCAQHRSGALVEFDERTRDGLTLRSVRGCSLRLPDGECSEECRYLVVTPAHGAEGCVMRKRPVSV